MLILHVWMMVFLLQDSAEFGRIGRYYAAESMLVWDEKRQVGTAAAEHPQQMSFGCCPALQLLALHSGCCVYLPRLSHCFLVCL